MLKIKPCAPGEIIQMGSFGSKRTKQSNPQSLVNWVSLGKNETRRWNSRWQNSEYRNRKILRKLKHQI